MSFGRTPPQPHGDWKAWALQLVEFLQDRSPRKGEVIPSPLALQHLVGTVPEKTTLDGVLMFDPQQPAPVVSIGGVWNTLAASGDGEGHMKWRGYYATGTEYFPYDVTLSGNYLALANVPTFDDPAPVESGDPYLMYQGASPTNAITAKQLTVFTDIVLQEPSAGIQYQIYTVTGNEYSVFRVINDGLVVEIVSFTATTTGWQTFDADGTIYATGTKLRLGVRILEPDPTPTTWTSNWSYNKPNNWEIPGPGDAIHANRRLDVISIHTADDGNVDRSQELLALTAGDTIAVGGTTWSIQSAPTNEGTYVDFVVAPAVQDVVSGVETFTFETVTATPITTVVDVNYYDDGTYPHISGGYQIDGGAPEETDDAYGVNLNLQPYAASPDWTILAVTGTTGGGGGASSFLELSDTPSSWGSPLNVPVVNGTSDALEWGNLAQYFVLNTGGTFTGVVSLTRAGQDLLRLTNTAAGNPNAHVFRGMSTGDLALAHGTGSITTHLFEADADNLKSDKSVVTREKGDARWGVGGSGYSNYDGSATWVEVWNGATDPNLTLWESTTVLASLDTDYDYRLLMEDGIANDNSNLYARLGFPSGDKNSLSVLGLGLTSLNTWWLDLYDLHRAKKMWPVVKYNGDAVSFVQTVDEAPTMMGIQLTNSRFFSDGRLYLLRRKR